MDIWEGNGPAIEEVLGLFPRRPWYWPFSGTRHGSYRGYDVIVRLYPGGGSETGPTSTYTTFQVDLDRSAVGPSGFRRVGRLSPRRAVRIGRDRFTAHNVEELTDWLTDSKRAVIKRVMNRKVWFVKRNWRQFILHKSNYRATDVEKIRKGLDQLVNTVETLRST